MSHGSSSQKRRCAEKNMILLNRYHTGGSGQIKAIEAFSLDTSQSAIWMLWRPGAPYHFGAATWKPFIRTKHPESAWI